jgi:histidine triad (HIT) family protein/ATP adenylyltransferase
MSMDSPRRVAFDLAAYGRRTREGSCFVCAFVDGDPDYRHHRIYEDDQVIAFLARYPTLRGQTLIAPKRHIESWVTDLTQAEFLAFQAVIHQVGRALTATLPVERMYALSLGSQQGNAHVHWHLAPLPPGVPYRDQQHRALMTEHGILGISDAAQQALASAIARHLRATQPPPPS